MGSNLERYHVHFNKRFGSSIMIFFKKCQYCEDLDNQGLEIVLFFKSLEETQFSVSHLPSFMPCKMLRTTKIHTYLLACHFVFKGTSKQLVVFPKWFFRQSTFLIALAPMFEVVENCFTPFSLRVA